MMFFPLNMHMTFGIIFIVNILSTTPCRHIEFISLLTCANRNTRTHYGSPTHAPVTLVVWGSDHKWHLTPNAYEIDKAFWKISTCIANDSHAFQSMARKNDNNAPRQPEAGSYKPPTLTAIKSSNAELQQLLTLAPMKAWCLSPALGDHFNVSLITVFLRMGGLLGNAD